MNAIEQIRSLEAQREELIQTAHDDAITTINDAIETLKALGFQYSLVSKKKPVRKSKPQPVTNKPCSVCGFATDPPHDKRHHRSQDVVAPFTDKELLQRGLTRLDEEPIVPVEPEHQSDKPSAETLPATSF